MHTRRSICAGAHRAHSSSKQCAPDSSVPDAGQTELLANAGAGSHGGKVGPRNRGAASVTERARTRHEADATQRCVESRTCAASSPLEMRSWWQLCSCEVDGRRSVVGFEQLALTEEIPLQLFLHLRGRAVHVLQGPAQKALKSIARRCEVIKGSTACGRTESHHNLLLQLLLHDVLLSQRLDQPCASATVA